jgi:hypothetical protein
MHPRSHDSNTFESYILEFTSSVRDFWLVRSRGRVGGKWIFRDGWRFRSKWRDPRF